MLRLWSYLESVFADDERGATMVEYGIMIALIAVVSIAVIATIGTDLLAAFTSVEAQLP